jgi:hypothetical protein
VHPVSLAQVRSGPTRSLAAVLGLGFLLAGCDTKADLAVSPLGSPTRSANPTAEPSATARPGSYCALHDDPSSCQPVEHVASAAPGERVYEGFGVRTAPAPPEAQPRISRARAVAIARAGAYRDTVAGADPTVALRLFTDGDFTYDPQWNPDPASNRRHDQVLAWVITWYDREPVPMHGPSGFTRPTGLPADCEVDAFIEARSGQILAQWEHCPQPAEDRR